MNALASGWIRIWGDGDAVDGSVGLPVPSPVEAEPLIVR